MVLNGHLEAAGFIKYVHEELREKSKSVGVEKAWQEHCADDEKLEKYAVCMKELATNFWEQPKKVSRDLSRISWIHQSCVNYFTKEIFHVRLKEFEILTKLHKNIDSLFGKIESKWTFLDVGSCYNPFKHFEKFEVTAIDIAPAVKDVYKCDFLGVKVGQTFNLQDNEMKQLPENYFDVVIFCLLLEYLPSPHQRKIACKKSYNLLKTEGILLLITPDSNHVGSNAKYIKSWRFILANMGFSRIKYEKLKHIHCMVFRKSIIVEIPRRWADIHKKEQVFDEIYIPQDFKTKPQELETSRNPPQFDCEDMVKINKELPFFDVFQ